MSPLIISHKQTQQPNSKQHPFSRQFPVSMQILFSPVMLDCISLTCQYNMGFWIQNIESSLGERDPNNSKVQLACCWSMGCLAAKQTGLESLLGYSEID